MERVVEGSVIIVESRWKMNPEILPDYDSWYLRKYGETRVAYWGLVDEEPEDEYDDDDNDLEDDDELNEADLESDDDDDDDDGSIG